MARKRQLRNEWRKAPRKAPRREIGRTPNWVFQERRDRNRNDED
jgi:hypothetical protein